MNCVVFVELNIQNFIYSKKVLLYIYYAIIYLSNLSQLRISRKKYKRNHLIMIASWISSSLVFIQEYFKINIVHFKDQIDKSIEGYIINIFSIINTFPVLPPTSFYNNILYFSLWIILYISTQSYYGKFAIFGVVSISQIVKGLFSLIQ